MRAIVVAAMTVVAAVASASSALADPVPRLPESGKARFEVTYFRAGPGHDVSLDDQTGFGSFEQYGATRNLDGQPWFDRMTEYCTGQYYDAAGQPPAPTNGACVYVDLDGDKVTINWVDHGDGGTKQVVGGSGKYAGISGAGRYFFDTELKPPTEEARMFITRVELDFKMKGPSQ